MNHRALKFIFVFLIIFSPAVFGQAQIKKAALSRILIEIEQQEKLLAECRSKRLPVSHFCNNGFCLIRLVLPDYPKEARQFGIRGQVRVEAAVDEIGKVLNARSLEARPFLSRAARQAAIYAQFEPRRNCENKPVKFRVVIIYNFYGNERI